MRRRVPLFVAVTLAIAVPGPRATGAVTGEVISATNATTGRAVVFSASDGTQRKELGCGGELSNSAAFAGRRFYAYSKDDAQGDGDLHAIDEDCVNAVVLLSDPGLDIGPWVAWSPSGNRIAFHAVLKDLLGQRLAEGLFVGIVQRDSAMRPQSVVGVRLAFRMAAAHVSWSGDEKRVTFAQELPSDRYVGGTQGDVFVGDVDTGSVVNLTASDVGEYHPTFSPTEDAIAYVTRTTTSRGGAYRNDIIVLNPTTGVSTQVTNKSNTNAAQILHPSYAPSGTSIAFSGWPSSGGANIYRLPLTVSGRAIDLTSSSSDIHYAPQWRS